MTYTLPELPYDYAALEPHISAKIMELHHDRHHAAYVAGANAALANLEAARDAGDLSKVNQFSKDLAFNLGGHTNHSIFWTNLSPAGGGQPEGELAEAVKDSFGSFEKFVAHFTAAATGIQGSGWAVLAYDSISEKLVVFQLFDQQANVPAGTIPLEHRQLGERRRAPRGREGPGRRAHRSLTRRRGRRERIAFPAAPAFAVHISEAASQAPSVTSCSEAL